MVEVLEGPSQHPRHRWLVGLAVVALLVGAAAVWVEGVRRGPGERRALVACATAAEQATNRAERRLSTMANYVSPALGRGSPRLRETMLRLVADQADSLVGSLDAARASCAAVSVWPFNRSHHEARSAYVAFLDAERTRLQRIAADGSSIYDGYREVQAMADEAAALLAD